MQALTAQFNKYLSELSVVQEGLELELPSNDEQIKKLKKKLKKHTVDPKEDDLAAAIEKLNKMLDYLNKSYEGAVKAQNQYAQSRENKQALVAELNKELQHKKRLESLHSNFMKKYNEELKAAQNYEVEETDNKKKYTEELQNRIKLIQDQFEESGKKKIEAIRQNEMCKDEVSRLKSHLEASQALVDAQLKKKSLEIDIQLSTLKQKIDLIQTMKNHGAGSEEKLIKATGDCEKIEVRLKVFQEKEEEHKLAITKAHLLIEDYKAAIFKIRELLEKLSTESQKLSQKCKKSEEALRSSKEEQNRQKSERDVQNTQLQGLKNLETTLKEQLKKL